MFDITIFWQWKVNAHLGGDSDLIQIDTLRSTIPIVWPIALLWTPTKNVKNKWQWTDFFLSEIIYLVGIKHHLMIRIWVKDHIPSMMRQLEKRKMGCFYISLPVKHREYCGITLSIACLSHPWTLKLLYIQLSLVPSHSYALKNNTGHSEDI